MLFDGRLNWKAPVTFFSVHFKFLRATLLFIYFAKEKLQSGPIRKCVVEWNVYIGNVWKIECKHNSIIPHSERDTYYGGSPLFHVDTFPSRAPSSPTPHSTSILNIYTWYMYVHGRWIFICNATRQKSGADKRATGQFEMRALPPVLVPTAVIIECDRRKKKKRPFFLSHVGLLEATRHPRPLAFWKHILQKNSPSLALLSHNGWEEDIVSQGWNSGHLYIYSRREKKGRKQSKTPTDASAFSVHPRCYWSAWGEKNRKRQQHLKKSCIWMASRDMARSFTSA